MQDTNINSPRLSALDRLKISMEASRENMRKLKHLAYEQLGENGAIGRINRFMAKKSKAALGFFASENPWTAVALTQAFSGPSFNLFEAIKNLNFFTPTSEPTPPTITERLSAEFDDIALANTYVTAEVAARLIADEEAFEAQLQNDTAETFDKIAENVQAGQYVGINGLVAELNAIQTAAEDEHGLKMIFDEHGSHCYAHCEHKVEGLKSEFAALNEAGEPAAEASERVLTFDAAASPASAKTPNITSFIPKMPDISGMETNTATVPIPVLAVTPPRPGQMFGPRGI